jgi:hypothetical protein
MALTIQLMSTKNAAAVALGRRGGKAKNAKLTQEQKNEMMAKARERLAEVRKGKGVHPKIHTLKAPCTFPGCKVTVGHEHIKN